ncbi:OmpP1/FadL family transporter [Chitinophagaceae bacterium MMS25-I14]
MNYNRRIAIIAAACWILTGCSYVAWAQDEIDALRYSYQSVQGTARSMGFGNALGSVGGDFSSLSVNPAGIGIYRSSEMMITPSLKVNGADGTYQGNTMNDNGSRFNISNFGAVFTTAQRGRRYDKSNWKTFSFGIGINRVADFTHNYTYSGKNSGDGSSSASELFAIDANQHPGDAAGPGTPGTLAYMGYQSYLLNQDSSGNFYTNVPWKAGINQQRTVKERGGISEIVLSFGGNYKEKLMLGATVGLPTLHYQRDASYTEAALDPSTSPNFNSFRINETLTTSGFGGNLKLGFIYKVNDYFRFGGAFHTPTVYAMSDVYDQSLLVNTNGANPNGDYWYDATQSRFNYTLFTPWKAVLSATGMLGKIGFITADYEYVNYHSMRYSFSGTDDFGNDFKDYQSAVNQLIKDTYKGASNFRAGVEIRLDQLSLRGGFGYYGSPYKNSFSGADRLDFSAGLGFRFTHTFIDLAYVHSTYKNQEQPYVFPGDLPAYQSVVVPTATIKNNNNNVALTLGFKF